MPGPEILRAIADLATHAVALTAPAATVSAGDLIVTPRELTIEASGRADYVLITSLYTLDIDISTVTMDVRYRDGRGGEQRVNLRGRGEIDLLALGRRVSIIVRSRHLAAVNMIALAAPLTEGQFRAIADAILAGPQKVAVV